MFNIFRKKTPPPDSPQKKVYCDQCRWFGFKDEIKAAVCFHPETANRDKIHSYVYAPKPGQVLCFFENFHGDCQRFEAKEST